MRFQIYSLEALWDFFQRLLKAADWLLWNMVYKSLI